MGKNKKKQNKSSAGAAQSKSEAETVKSHIQTTAIGDGPSLKDESFSEPAKHARDRSISKDRTRRDSESSHSKDPFRLQSSRKSDYYNARKNEPYTDQDREERRNDSYQNSSKRLRENYDYHGNSRYKRDQNRDKDFDLYQKEVEKHRGNTKYVRVTEITQNLFNMDESYSLAHCVAEDMNMGSGIAVQFRRDFKRVDELLNQRQRPGGLAILECKNRFIYYLVTKRFSSGKPTYNNLFRSLKKMKEHVIEHNVKKIAMPRIGCGLDLLEWDKVKFMVEFLFKDSEVEIVVCNFDPSMHSQQQRHVNSKVVYETYPIQNIDIETVILYFSSEDGVISEEMKNLDEKFSILREFRCANKNLGDVIFYTKNQNYLICGCIVRKTHRDEFNFGALQKCLSKILKENKNKNFYFFAFQAFKDEQDTIINEKIVNILRNSLHNSEIYVCDPKNIRNQQVASSDRFSSKKLDYNRKEFRSPGRNQSFGNGSLRSGSKDQSQRMYTDSNTSQNVNNDGECLSNEKIDSWDQDSSSQADQSVYTSADQFTSEENSTIYYQCAQQKEQNSNFLPPTNTTENFSNLNPDVPSFTPNNQAQNLTDESPTENVPDVDDFQLFQKQLEANEIDLSVMKEFKDLSKLPDDCCRVCFAGEDLSIEYGLPLEGDILSSFGKHFNQNFSEGNIIPVNEKNTSFLLIVNKPRKDPTLETVFTALRKLQQYVEKHGIREIVFPKISKTTGCSFDWSKLKHICQLIFKKSNIMLMFAPNNPIYNEISYFKLFNNKLEHSKSALHQLKKNSGVIYLASVDGNVTKDMGGLNRQFKFLDDFNARTKRLGDVVTFKSNEHVLYGCIVKNRQSDGLNFEELQKCIKKVNEDVQKERFKLVGIQAVNTDDETTNYKIATILMVNLHQVTIRMCWPSELKDKMPSSRKT